MNDKEKMKILVKKSLKTMKWDYCDQLSDEIYFILTGLNFGGGLKANSLVIRIRIIEEGVYVLSTIGAKSSKERLAATSEYIQRVNAGLVDGNFELCYESGRVSYKIFRSLPTKNKEIISSLTNSYTMWKIYGGGLIDVIFHQKNPEAILKQIEGYE